MAETRIDLNQISSLDNSNTLKDDIQSLKNANQKVIVFVLAGNLRLGIQKPVIRFPSEGTITEVYGYCTVTGDEQTVISIEKSSQEDINNSTGNWSNIFSQNLTFDIDSNNTSVSSIPYQFQEDNVDANDHFRVNILNGDLKSQDLTIEITIKGR